MITQQLAHWAIELFFLGAGAFALWSIWNDLTRVVQNPRDHMEGDE